MAKLPNFKRLYKTDFKQENQDLIEQLSFIINGAFDSIYQTLNQQVSLQDNIQCTVKDVTVVVDATGKPTSTSSMSLSANGQVTGLTVIMANNITNSTTYPTGMPFISYTVSGKTVIFNNITGLQANNKYTLRVIAFQS
jgi:hypothetical protein